MFPAWVWRGEVALSGVSRRPSDRACTGDMGTLWALRPQAS